MAHPATAPIPLAHRGEEVMTNQLEENPAMPEIRYFFSARVQEPGTFWRSGKSYSLHGTLTANRPIDIPDIQRLVRNKQNVSDKADIIILAFNTLP
jgi:hypothetical protein